eukprot:Rmarinus@m.28336
MAGSGLSLHNRFRNAYFGGYGTLLAIIIISEFYPVPIWTYMIVAATACVYLGAHKSVEQIDKPAEAGGQAQEVVGEKEALRFPIMASVMLFGLFLALKFLPKEYVMWAISLYAVLLGAYAFADVLSFFVGRVLPSGLSDRFDVLPSFLKSFGDFTVAVSIVDLICLSISGGTGILYLVHRHYIANNVIAASMCLTALEIMTLSSYKVACILLCGLFVYDVFWVFGTVVMVTVAKGIDAPIKLMFPKDIFALTRDFSMLGLGDIVVPGLFLALLLRFDVRRMQNSGASTLSKTYFHSGVFGYVLGLAATYAVMVGFESAQPALLYLVPSCIGSSMCTALARGEFKQLVSFTEETEASKAEKENPKKE